MKKTFFALCMMLPLMLQAATLGPDELVRQTSEKVLSTLEKNKALYDKEPDRIYQLVDDIILPHLDFVAMSKLALGKMGSRLQEVSHADESSAVPARAVDV